MISETDSDSLGWIQWFCSLEDHHFFIELDEDYIRDTFNLYGLRQRIENYDEALKMILSEECPDSEDFDNLQFAKLYESAMDLYGLIHARYIVSPIGLKIMYEKYCMGAFGTCPRLKCKKQKVLPIGGGSVQKVPSDNPEAVDIGISEELNQSRVKIYCPKCQDVYQAK